LQEEEEEEEEVVVVALRQLAPLTVAELIQPVLVSQ